jgi:hypothetical protein
MESAKEICLKQYHKELAQKQLEWDLPRRLADAIGVSLSDFSDEDFALIIDLGRAIYWDKTFDRILRAIGREFNESFNEEIDSWKEEIF